MADRRYYWLKMKKDFFKRHDIRIIEAMPNGKDYVLFYLKLLLESIDHDGSLRFSDTIPYDEQMLSIITNTNIDIVRSALKLFCELNLVEVMDDKTIYLQEVQSMIGDETEWAEKKRLFRESKLKSVLQIEDNARTKKDNVRQEKEIEKEIDTELEKEIEKGVLSPDKQAQVLSKKPKTKKRVDIVFMGSLSQPLIDALQKFIDFRIGIKAPMQQNAVDLLIARLNKIGKTDEERIAILEQSIMSGWKGIFELKEGATKYPEKPKQNFEGVTYTAEEIKGFEDDPAELLKRYTQRKQEGT